MLNNYVVFVIKIFLTIAAEIIKNMQSCVSLSATKGFYEP